MPGRLSSRGLALAVALAAGGAAGVRMEAKFEAGRLEAELVSQATSSSTAAEEPEEEPAAPSDDADRRCDEAALGGTRRSAAWRHFRKCTCAQEGYVVACQDVEKCPGIGRYFKESLQGQSCACVPDTCKADCAVVEGAVWRRSAWRRSSEKCKCPAGHAIGGTGQACAMQWATKSRHFAIDVLKGRGCACYPEDATIEATRPSIPVDEPPLEERQQQQQEDEQSEPGAAVPHGHSALWMLLAIWAATVAGAC